MGKQAKAKTDGAKTKKPRKKGSNSPQMQAKRKSEFAYRQQMHRELVMSVADLTEFIWVFDDAIKGVGSVLGSEKVVEFYSKSIKALQEAKEFMGISEDLTSHITKQFPNNFDQKIKANIKQIGFCLRNLKAEITKYDKSKGFENVALVVEIIARKPRLLFIKDKKAYGKIYDQVKTRRSDLKAQEKALQEVNAEAKSETKAESELVQ